MLGKGKKKTNDKKIAPKKIIKKKGLGNEGKEVLKTVNAKVGGEISPEVQSKMKKRKWLSKKINWQMLYRRK